MIPSKYHVTVVVAFPGKIVAWAVDRPRVIRQRTAGSLVCISTSAALDPQQPDGDSRENPQRGAQLSMASGDHVEDRVQDETPQNALRDRQCQRNEDDGDECGERILNRAKVER